MNKKELEIKRISKEGIQTRTDYVASEKNIRFTLESGKEICLTCSPGDENELITGHRYISENHSNSEGTAALLKKVSIDQLLEFSQKVFSIPEELFDATGCAHSCALIYEDKILCHMEDIRRHNALDKAVGYAVIHDIPLYDTIVFTSGRISCDYLQKVIDAGIGIAVSRAAVTDAAIELAVKNNTTLIGFARENRANLYHEGRIEISENDGGNLG